jgi:hypothetical protein
VRIIHFLQAGLNISFRFAKWKREAEEWYAHDSALFEGLFEAVRDRVVCIETVPRMSFYSPHLMQHKGDERPSLTATLIQDAGRHGLSLRENSWLAATM